MWIRYLRPIIIFVAFVGTLAPIPGFACSCVRPGTAQQEQAKSTLVFVGRVAAIEQRSSQMDKNSLTLAWEWVCDLFGSQSTSEPDHRYQRVGFQVKRTVKGFPSSYVQLSTVMGGGDCGYEFEMDKEFWVYARGIDTALTVSICSLTGPTNPHTAK